MVKKIIKIVKMKTNKGRKHDEPNAPLFSGFVALFLLLISLFENFNTPFLTS